LVTRVMAMRLREDLRHAAVGALALAVIGWGLAASYASGRVHTSETEGLRVLAEYGNAEGIDVGALVTLAGVPIGKVDGLRWDDGNRRVTVAMVLTSPVEIPADSVAKVASDGMFGVKYIQISPGGDIDTLTSGDYFDYVQDAVNFESLMERVVTQAEERRAAKHK